MLHSSCHRLSYWLLRFRPALSIQSSEMHLSCTLFCDDLPSILVLVKDRVAQQLTDMEFYCGKMPMQSIENYWNKRFTISLRWFWNPRSLRLLHIHWIRLHVQQHNIYTATIFALDGLVNVIDDCNLTEQSALDNIGYAIVCMVATRSCYSLLLCTTKMRPIALILPQLHTGNQCAPGQELLMHPRKID